MIFFLFDRLNGDSIPWPFKHWQWNSNHFVIWWWWWWLQVESLTIPLGELLVGRGDSCRLRLGSSLLLGEKRHRLESGGARRRWSWSGCAAEAQAVSEHLRHSNGGCKGSHFHRRKRESVEKRLTWNSKPQTPTKKIPFVDVDVPTRIRFLVLSLVACRILIGLCCWRGISPDNLITSTRFDFIYYYYIYYLTTAFLHLQIHLNIIHGSLKQEHLQNSLLARVLFHTNTGLTNLIINQ